jgi:hypothetical protein
MITLDFVRAAVLSDQPWMKLDELVRAEMAAGRKVKEIFGDLKVMVDEVWDTPGLTENGEDAFGDTLDALTGNCRREHCYFDPPTLPTEEEMAELPRWARVAFAARCARRVLPLFSLSVHQIPVQLLKTISSEILFAESIAASPQNGDLPPRNFDSAVSNSLVGDPSDQAAFKAAFGSSAFAIGRCALAATFGAAGATIVTEAANLAHTAAAGVTDITSDLRRDFDRLARHAQYQRWDDDTPVSPKFFGPLWPEGAPPGWPADPETPRHMELELDLITSDHVIDRIVEDEVVNLFQAINRYHIARGAGPLKLNEFFLYLNPIHAPVEV